MGCPKIEGSLKIEVVLNHSCIPLYFWTCSVSSKHRVTKARQGNLRTAMCRVLTVEQVDQVFA